MTISTYQASGNWSEEAEEEKEQMTNSEDSEMGGR